MTDIVIRPPAKNKPGYLRRMREAAAIQERLTRGATLEDFDAMIDFALKHCEIEAPAGVDVKDVLLDLSEEAFKALFQQIIGEGSSAVPPPTGA